MNNDAIVHYDKNHPDAAFFGTHKISLFGHDLLHRCMHFFFAINGKTWDPKTHTIWFSLS